MIIGRHVCLHCKDILTDQVIQVCFAYWQTLAGQMCFILKYGLVIRLSVNNAWGRIHFWLSFVAKQYYKLKGEWEELLPQVYVPLESPSHLWLAVPLQAPSSTFGASVMPASWPASSLGEETQFQKVKTEVLHEKKKKDRWFECLRVPFAVLQVGGNLFISLAMPFILLRLC